MCNVAFSYSVLWRACDGTAAALPCFILQVRAFTQSAATIEARPGGKFSWFNGSVVGEFVEMEADKRLVMNWRFSTWKEGCFSKVGGVSLGCTGSCYDGSESCVKGDRHTAQV